MRDTHIDARAAIHAPHCSGGNPQQWETLRESERRRVCARCLPPRARPTDDPFRLGQESERIVTDIFSGGVPVHLAGHSHGGAVALSIAVRIPHMVRSLALYEPVAFHLLDPSNARDERATGEFDQVAHRIVAAIRNDDATRAARMLLEYWGSRSVWPSLSKIARGIVRNHLPKAQAEFDAMLCEPYTAAEYRRLDFPCLILKGSLSLNVPTSLTDGASHMGPITHADAVAAGLSTFFDSVEAARPTAA